MRFIPMLIPTATVTALVAWLIDVSHGASGIVHALDAVAAGL